MSAMTLYRVARWCARYHIPLVPSLMRVLTLFLFSSVVPVTAEIGEGTQLGYRGIAVVIHSRAVIGRECMISPGVVVGGRSGYRRVPVIGDRVFIGAGAKVLGPLTVGDDAIIGANAVVLEDVPPGAVVAGVPAKLIRQGAHGEDSLWLLHGSPEEGGPVDR